MTFYDSIGKQAICQEIDRLCDSNDTSYPRLDKTARVNQALEELVAEAINSDGVWEYDDTNYTDLPVGTGNLVEGQESYSFASQYLKIKRVKVKDINGKFQLLKQIDQQDLEQVGFLREMRRDSTFLSPAGVSIENYFGTDANGNPFKGLPLFYDLLGDSFRIYPSPTSTFVTLTGGLKVEFVRTANLFTAVATTVVDSTVPGLPSPYHNLLAYYAAIVYCELYKPERVPLFKNKWDVGVKNLIRFYSKRNPDRRDKLTMRPIYFR